VLGQVHRHLDHFPSDDHRATDHDDRAADYDHGDSCDRGHDYDGGRGLGCGGAG
jgi:hypothetical protein